MRDRNAPLSAAGLDRLDWDKMDGLIPAIVQDRETRQVLMLGYMSREALEATLASGFVTFHSRSKDRLWQKGETSGNRLRLVSIIPDCDRDALLVEAIPSGPVCHLGTTSCFGEESAAGVGWLALLARIVGERACSGGKESYTRQLLEAGSERIAQKIGEEGVELALASVCRDRAGCVDELSDLIYHATVLMEAKGFGWEDVAARLRERHSAPSK